MQSGDTEPTWKPVAYASCSMSETERRYTQIEKEALATTWACDKFAPYILGKKNFAYDWQGMTISFHMSQGNTCTQQILCDEHPSPHQPMLTPTTPRLKKQRPSWKCVLLIYQPALRELMSIVPHRPLIQHVPQ